MEKHSKYEVTGKFPMPLCEIHLNLFPALSCALASPNLNAGQGRSF